MNMEQRRYQCPTLPLGGCDWQGLAEDLPLHFEVSHRSLRVQKTKLHNRYDQAYINGPIDVQRDSEVNQLLIYSEDIFVFQLKVDHAAEKLWVGVRHIGSYEVKFSYHILIDSEIPSTKIQKTGMVQLDSDWSFDVQSMLEFDLSLVMRTEIKGIYYSLRICDPENRTCFDQREFRCIVCGNSCFPRAFACGKGHLVCVHCKRVDSRCGHVASTPCSSMVRNLIRSIGYPCKNERFGCNVILPKTAIRFHEGLCFALPSCFAEKECKFVGVAFNWWYHLLEKHPDMVSLLHQEWCYDIREMYCKKMFIKTGLVLYKIVCERQRLDDPFFWSCQQLGLKPGVEPLEELSVGAVDLGNPKSEVVGRVICCPLNLPEDEATERCIVTPDTLQPYIVDNKFRIRLYIQRVEQ